MGGRLNQTASDLNYRIEQLKKQKLAELREKFNLKTDNGFWELCKYLYPDFFNDTQTERKRYAEILQNAGRWSILRDEKYKRYRKIMINIFPRFAKSFMLTIWCVYCLGEFPKGTIMRNAHDATLAEKFSRDVRNMIENLNDEAESNSTYKSVQSKIQAIYPHLKLSRDKKSLNMWALKTAKDISYFCAGVKGAINGNGCDVAMIIDDPVKDPEKALSSTFNNELVDWYLTVHRSRRDRDSEAQGCEIIVMARWSDDDLCGQLLRAESDWLVFTFDAENESGQSGCEGVLSTKDMLELKQGYINTGRIKWWNALYRQKTDGVSRKLFVKTELLRYSPDKFDFKSSRFDSVAFCDVADTGSDSLSAPFAYFDKVTGDLYIYDWIFTDEPSEISIGYITIAIQTHKPNLITFESNNGGRWYAQLVQQELESVNYFDTAIEARHTQSNKETKILVTSPLVLSKVYFLSEECIEIGSQYYLAINALCSYEKEKKNLHDDAPDSITSLAQMYCQKNSFQCF